MCIYLCSRLDQTFAPRSVRLPVSSNLLIFVSKMYVDTNNVTKQFVFFLGFKHFIIVCYKNQNFKNFT